MAEDWIEVGWVRSRHESERDADADRLLDAWLAARDLTRASLGERDARVDLVYLGPGKGCDARVLVARSVVERAETLCGEVEAMVRHLVDLESPWDPGVVRGYDAVSLVRHALSWPSDYWPGLALSWLEQGLPVDGLLDVLRRFEAESQRAQSQRHRARALRKGAGG